MKAYLAIAAACIVCGILAYRVTRHRGDGADKATGAHTFVFEVFDTEVRISVFDEPADKVREAVHEMSQSLSDLHEAINVYDASSELSGVNENAYDAPVACSPLLWDMLVQARNAWEISGHLFDVTIGPLSHLWGFHTRQDRLPDEQGIKSILKQVGFDKLQLDEKTRTVAFSAPGMQLDFGGIAKGYALQQLIPIATKHGLRNYRIDLGGNIYSSQPLQVGVRHPRDAEKIVHTVTLNGQCIATSGNYERYRAIQGKRIGHIMDPRTGYPCDVPELYESVTAVTPNPTYSDVFSTAAFVGGYAMAEKLAREFKETYFVFVAFDGAGSPVMTVIDGKTNP